MTRTCVLNIIKNNFLSVFILFFFANSSFSQSTGSIIGNVFSNQQAVEFATVALSNTTDTTKVLYYTTTDSLGKFTFSNIGFGDYFLKISLIGHQSTTQTISLSNQNNSLTLNNIHLNKDISKRLLTAVTVTTQKKLIQKTTEGFIVNAEANITQAGGTATDLLKGTPTVAVDADGGITLRGKAPLILINGRNSAFTTIDQIPASNIESIEIINNASAKYDANAQSGIINIKLKKNKTNGTNGAISLGAGVGSRGRTANSIIVNHKTSKWNVGLGYDNRFAGRTKHITLDRTNFYFPDTYSLNQIRNDERMERLQNMKFNTDFTPDNKNTFSFEAIGNIEGQDNDETLNSTNYKQSKSFNDANSRHALELKRSKLAEFTLGYNRKFLNPKKSLAINFTTSIQQERENTDITTQNLTENKTNLYDPSLQKTHNYANENISNAIIDYAFPIFKNRTLETGYKGTFRQSKNDYEASEKVGNNYIINSTATNIFTFNEQVHAAYLLLHSFIGAEDNPKYKYDIGVRLEQVNNNGNTQNNPTQFANKYLKLFPTASFSYLMPNNQAIKLSYAKRINRPELDNLNPFVDITDALNPHSGNPNLKPEIIQALEFGYNKEWKNYSLTSSLFYRYAENTIRGYQITQANGSVLRLPQNIGTANSYGIENIITAKPTKIYDVNVSFTLFQQELNSSNVTTDVVQKAFNWYGKLINNISIGTRGKIQIIGNYNSAQTTPQGNLTSIYNIDLGFQQKLGKGNSRFGLIVVDVFNTLKSGNNIYTNNFISNRTQKADTRAIMLTFACSFKSVFKEHLLDNKFSKEF